MNSESDILKDRFDALPGELRKLLASEELQRKIDLLAKKHKLTEDQQTAMENEIGIILLQLDSTSNLAPNLAASLVVSPGTAASLAGEISDYILRQVSRFLAHTDNDLTVQTEAKVAPQISTGQEYHPSKEEIVEGIERPFKTVITKYVIEYDHKPMDDASHLLEDKVDEVPKLEEKWED